MQNKILTIVVPTYNTEKYLPRCLSSLLFDKKTNEKIELIVVNDGSKDSSLEIARFYEAKYPNTVSVIDKENGGHGSTINAGLKVASGKYFRVVDSDDWVNIDDFPDYVNALEKEDADMIITDYSREEVASGVSISSTFIDLIEINVLYDVNSFDFSTLKDKRFGMANITYKTKILNEANLYLDEKMFYVDMEYIILPAPYIKTFKYLDFDIYRYFLGRAEQSVSTKSYVKNSAHHEKMMRRVIDFYSGLSDEEKIKKYIGKIISSLLETHYFVFCKWGETAEMRENIREFDSYLKSTAIDLYKKTNSGYIMANRKTNFIFVSRAGNVFSRLISKLSRGK